MEGKYIMKILNQNTIVKKILIIFITILMISNFIMPNYVQAAASAGEKLVSGLFYLVVKLGDVGISLMQKFMTGDGQILDEESDYEIKYSPGMIFSGEVPMLNINFITASEENGKITISTTTEGTETIDLECDFSITRTGEENIEADLDEYLQGKRLSR